MKLISFDLQADFGFFRKPDTNNTINLSYNVIHRPSVLGILGAIIGLEGYKEKGKWPLYYEKMKDLRLGVEPLKHDKGNFSKTNIKYSNTVGYANKGANFLTEELTLISPSYRIFVLLDENNELHKTLESNLRNGKAEYIPYFGKNEYAAWWEASSFREYDFSEKEIKSDESIAIKTVFLKALLLKDNTDQPNVDFLSDTLDTETAYYVYFERLPKDFDLDLMQYDMAEYAFSNYPIKNAHHIVNLVYINQLDAYVQLL